MLFPNPTNKFSKYEGENKMKKILSLLLSVSIILSVVPIAQMPIVYAAEENVQVSSNPNDV